MGNRASIEQQTITVKYNGEEDKIIAIFDDYGQGSLSLAEYCDTFYDDDLELLLAVLERIQETTGIENVENVIDNVYENKKGMSIEGEWYDWEQIKPIFDRVKYGEG